MIGVIYDITSRKMLEKLKDDFISVASHELKTPVTSIKGYSQILLENFKEAGDAESIDLLSKLNGQVDRLTKLLYTLLDSTSLLEGRLKLSPEPFDINELLEEQITELRHLSPEHDLVWRPGPVPLIHADKGRIRQVIINLVTNAMKYSPKGDIVISSVDALDGVLVSVQDFGPGIPPDQQESIFKRYYRVDQTAPNGQSLGLGLYISLEIIKQHKGTMGVDSLLGKGSTFYFKLPYS
jgi:signal transduction histidine kinase